MTDDELDRRFAALPPVEPPPEVQARVLAAVSDAGTGELAPLPSRRAPPRRLWAVTVGVLGLAAAALLAVGPTVPGRAEPESLVPRGDGPVLPSLALRVAVKRGAGVERLAAGHTYEAGDTLLFRVSASRPLDLVLRREGVVLFQGSVPAGDTDLPVGYALEAGERAARFVVEGGGASAAVEIAEVQR